MRHSAIMARVADTSRYGMMMAQNARRRAIVQQGMARSETMRSAMIASINNTANLMVKTTEMQLRSNAQAAAKAKLATFNKLA